MHSLNDDKLSDKYIFSPIDTTKIFKTKICIS